MIDVVVNDEIRGAREAVQLHDEHSVGVSIRRLIDLFDLPWRSLDKRALNYRLSRPGAEAADDVDAEAGDRAGGAADRVDERYFADDVTIGELALIPGETLVLSSPDASVVWAEVNGLIGQVEDELRLHVTDWRDDVTEEVRADVSRRLTDVRSEIERMARNRLRGEGARPSLRHRLRARRLMSRVARTGIAPDEVAGVRVGLSQLTTAASMAFRAAPFVAGAGLVGASAVAVEVADDDLSKEDVEEVLATTTTTGGPTTTGSGDGSTSVTDGGPTTTTDGGTVATGDELRLLLREELTVALAGQLTAEEVERIVNDAVGAVQDEETLRGLIRREVPGAERDEVTSQALGDVERTSPTRPLDSGQTLWAIAVDMQANPVDRGCGPGPFDESIAAYVRRIWAANAGTLGGDPDRIDPAETIRIPCPR